jgi:hypothetical protein
MVRHEVLRIPRCHRLYAWVPTAAPEPSSNLWIAGDYRGTSREPFRRAGRRGVMEVWPVFRFRVTFEVGGVRMDQQADATASRAVPPVASRARDGAAASSHSDLGQFPLLIPVPRAAQLLGISRSAAYRCAAAGDLPTAHLGGRVYVVTAKLRELLESA